MGIILSKVRISNYRSIESLSLDLGVFNLLIGQNNTGKTNFLKAVNIAVSGASDISEDDIFVSHDERLERSKTAVIDIMFQPIDTNGNTRAEFSVFWTSVFTDSWITTNPDGNFAAIRTEIKYDPIKDSYISNRRCILQWGESVENATIKTVRSIFNDDMRTYLQSFYMDANRDIVQDLRNRKSYFGRVTSSYDLTKEAIDGIEAQLNDANRIIIESIPALQQTKERISAIGPTIGAASSSVEIEPLARKITDLSKGMDIIMQDGKAASFSIAQHGFGTRSWISFLTLSAFIENQNKKLKEDDEAEQFIILTMEEPEAHLHPQAQRQLFEQISHFDGQKIVSTHSPSIVAQSKLADAIYFSKHDGKTSAKRYKAINSQSDEELIFREVVNTRADLLFASAIILCEGITEELALPVFFTEYFGYAPYALGVSIISTGGQKYNPYLALIKDFDLPWFIFSDGEPEAIKTVRSAVKDIFNLDYKLLSNVVLLNSGNEYEAYLIDEGYGEDIITAVCEYENNADYFAIYKRKNNGQNRKSSNAKKYKLSEVKDYDTPNGCHDALIDLCLENKTEYALPVAKKIVARDDVGTRIPAKILSLFEALARKIGVSSAIKEVIK